MLTPRFLLQATASAEVLSGNERRRNANGSFSQSSRLRVLFGAIETFCYRPEADFRSSTASSDSIELTTEFVDEVRLAGNRLSQIGLG